MKKNHFIKKLTYQNIFPVVILLYICLPGDISAQQPYYFHIIHSHAISASIGRTVKVNYMYQMNHARQLKISVNYIQDAYEHERDHITANIYNSNAQLQFNFVNKGRLFMNFALGGGGYFLTAKDVLNIKHEEWRFNFVAGLQTEIFMMRNKLAFTLDYDFCYMPWSKIYEFLHVPTIGITWFFF